MINVFEWLVCIAIRAFFIWKFLLSLINILNIKQRVFFNVFEWLVCIAKGITAIFYLKISIKPYKHFKHKTTCFLMYLNDLFALLKVLRQFFIWKFLSSLINILNIKQRFFNFLWTSRLKVGRRKEHILGYVPKNYERKNSGSKGLNYSWNCWHPAWSENSTHENSTHENSTQRKFHPAKIPPSENSTQRKLG